MTFPRLSPGRRGRTFRRLAGPALPVLATLMLRAFAAEAAVIPSGSMVPTLQVGDRILVLNPPFGLKLPWLPVKLLDGRAPRPGEVVVFMDPRNPSGDNLVKRVVASGGDLVAVRDNVPWVNGRALPRRTLPGACSFLAHDSLHDPGVPAPCQAILETNGEASYIVYQDPRSPPSSMAPRRVPAGHLFMMGDCRDNSADSRLWGTVPRSHVKGQVVGVLWSWEPGEGPRWERWLAGL